MTSGKCAVARWSSIFRDLDGENRPRSMTWLSRASKTDARSRSGQGRRQPDPGADMLGINRNTLRKKLTEYQLL